MSPTYSNQANDFLDKQSSRKSERIRRAINFLPAGDVRKLKGIKNGFRLRVGDVRVLFEREGNRIHVIKIDNRGDVYK